MESRVRGWWPLVHGGRPWIYGAWKMGRVEEYGLVGGLTFFYRSWLGG